MIRYSWSLAPASLTYDSHAQTSIVWSAGKGFQANLQDPRFNSLFTSADYALDPTDPRFKQLDGSKAVAQTVAHQQQRRQAHGSAPGFTAAAPSKKGVEDNKQSANGMHAGESHMGQNGDAAHLKSMVASLKRKASKQISRQQATSDSKQPVQAAKKKKQRVKA